VQVFLRLFFLLLSLVFLECSQLRLIMVVCISFVYNLISMRLFPYSSQLLFSLLLLLFASCLVFFISQSLLPFFVRYEFSLFPISIIILLFGYQPEKLSSTLCFLVYLILGSLPLFYWVVTEDGVITSYFSRLSRYTSFSVSLSFMFKTPLYTLHSWLPKAHVEAPLAGSIFLAGVLLKMGGYGILILSPYLLGICNLFIFLSLFGSVICSLLCFRCSDFKTWVAYSSVVHIGFVTLGALIGTEVGSWSALSILLSHSFVSPLLFLFASVTYESTFSRSFLIAFNTSLFPFPHLCLSLLVGLNFGLPPSLGFWSELTLFWAIGSRWGLALLVLGLSAFTGFLFCVTYYIKIVSSFLRSSASHLFPCFLFLPSFSFCFLSVFASSFMRL
jgi:NADH:ubiquinone oxidoreductase subunit 4 (subunit M)